ncbi:MAG: AMP-binding protein, partial [Bacteroidetes bacterium]|nr:AMP-binding protein [Bacteroidota bacterium]
KVTVGRRFFWGGHTLRQLEAKAPRDPFPILQPDPEQTAAILFTSGSTGVPKGVVTPFRVFAAQVKALREVYGIQPGERDLATFPLFALFGPALGMASVVPDMDASRPAEADPQRLFEAFRDYKCTNLFASPALIDKLGAEEIQVRVDVRAVGERLDGPLVLDLGLALLGGVALRVRTGVGQVTRARPRSRPVIVPHPYLERLNRAKAWAAAMGDGDVARYGVDGEQASAPAYRSPEVLPFLAGVASEVDGRPKMPVGLDVQVDVGVRVAGQFDGHVAVAALEGQ